MSPELFLQILMTYMHKPYIYGGKNPLQGLDCSGLACEVLAMCGLISTNEEMNAQQIHEHLTATPYLNKADIGAFVFYGASKTAIDHVAIFLDEDHVIEAGHGTPQTLTVADATARGARVRVRPYNYRTDLVEVVNFGLFAPKP